MATGGALAEVNTLEYSEELKSKFHAWYLSLVTSKGSFSFQIIPVGCFQDGREIYPMDMCNILCGASSLRLIGQNTIEEQFSFDKPDFCHLLVYIVGLRGSMERIGTFCIFTSSSLHRQSLSHLRLALLFVLKSRGHKIHLFSDKNIEISANCANVNIEVLILLQ